MSSIARVCEHDLPELLELVDAYLTFYGTAAERSDLEALCRALLADPEREGVQLLFVTPAARGTGLADALIGACLDLAREHGAVRLQWQTALDNTRAQAVYDRVGGRASSWVTYDLRVGTQ